MGSRAGYTVMLTDTWEVCGNASVFFGGRCSCVMCAKDQEKDPKRIDPLEHNSS